MSIKSISVMILVVFFCVGCPSQTEEEDLILTHGDGMLQIGEELYTPRSFDRDEVEEMPKLFTSELFINTGFTFGVDGQNEINIGKEEMASMSVEELRNLVTLIYLCKAFYPDSETVKILGEKLLPRYFVTIDNRMDNDKETE